MSVSASPLHGSCACERNQYLIHLPASKATLQSEAQIFFSNTLANRRSQAAPLTAWLRVPLSWYSSHTRAYFPDETHARIRRVYDTDAAGRTRRLFCGFCGTHLSAWREGQEQEEVRERAEEVLDVTLGSLEGESLARLQEMGLGGEEEEDDEEEDDEEEEEERQGDGLVKGGSVSREDHADTRGASVVVPRRAHAAHSMVGRGIPAFEDMIESSRLGQIRRRKGGHESGDGRVRVEWEIIEIEGDGEEVDDGEEHHVHKRVKVDVN